MGTCLEQYRNHIGKFNNRNVSCSKLSKCDISKQGCKSLVLRELLYAYMFMLCLVILLFTCLLLKGNYEWCGFMSHCYSAMEIRRALWLCVLLLLLSGDVEVNPGPNTKYTKNSGIAICHINIRSLKANYENVVTKMDLIQNEIAPCHDIITLSETWLNANDDANTFLLQGFQEPFVLNRNGMGGGVLCWVKQNIGVKRRLDLEISNWETIWLEIRLHNKIFLLCTTYRPPNDNDSYWENLQNSLDNCSFSDIKNLMIIGDINADPRTVAGRKLQNFSISNNLTMHIDEPTRVTENSTSILDQCLSNFKESVSKIEVFPPLSTNDHCTISVHIKFRNFKSESYRRLVWNFSSINETNFRSQLCNYDWDNSFAKSDIDDIAGEFTNNILETAKSHIDHKEVVIRPNDKSFFNGYLRRLRRKLNRLHKIVKLKNNVTHWERYRSNRNFYFREVKRCKQEYFDNIYENFDVSKLSTNDYFKTANRLLPFKKSNSDSCIPPLNNNGIIITKDADKARLFNEFFACASKLNDSNAKLPVNSYPIPGISIISEIIITEQEVKDQINILKCNKGFGPDQISPKFIKFGGHTLITPLTSLFNKSLQCARVPKIWKQANVIPIHKKESKSLITNYRPVSLLSVMSKMMERIIFKHLYNHFQDNFLLSVWQSGFRPGFSTITQLIELYQGFCTAVDNEKEIRVVFLDISKAFDKVWHDGLLFKLNKFGVSGKLLEWIGDYLSDRCQRVVINGKSSDWTDITAGVPQGSVLGPLLFLVYINDLINVISNCEIRIFADDTCLHIIVDNSVTAAKLLNEDLVAIEKWANQWLVDFSAPKTETMTISRKIKKCNHPPLSFFGAHVKKVHSHKHVGLWLDDNLGWNTHINEIETKSSKRLNILMAFKYKLSRKTIESMYQVFIRPILEYGNVVWIAATKNLLIKLDKIELRALRLTCGATYRSNINLLYKDAQWQSLESRREFHCLKMMFKIVNGLCPAYLTELLPRQVQDGHSFYLRKQNDYVIPKFRLSILKNSFLLKTLHKWNQLPAAIHNSDSVLGFHRNLKRLSCPSTDKFFKLLSYYGPRKSNILRARLRLNCSELNDHLCNYLHVITNPKCQCGSLCESVFHYFFECILYEKERDLLIQNLIPLTLDISTTTFLYGDLKISLDFNFKIIESVDKFIKDTHRFK